MLPINKMMHSWYPRNHYQCLRFIDTIHGIHSIIMPHKWSRVNLKDMLVTACQNIQLRLGFDPRLRPSERKRLVVLGTGWSCFHLISRINIKYFDVTIISPRHAFTFTPLLPSVCGGLLTTKTCFEPLRDKLLLRGGQPIITLHEAYATDLDAEHNLITCAGKLGQEFHVKYDYLVISVGNTTNTFNIPGVSEYGYFLKETEHAKRIHAKILENFELAGLPNTSNEDKSRLLHFIIVGGGATGVEAAAEIADFVNQDVSRYFGPLRRFVKITLIEMLPKVLSAYTEKASEYAKRNLHKCHVNLLLNTRVTKLEPSSIFVQSHDQSFEIPCGIVLWASGIKPVPFVHQISSKYSLEKARGLVVNERLQVQGLPSNVFASGDCASLKVKPLTSKSEQLYHEFLKSSKLSSRLWLESDAKKLYFHFPQLASFTQKSFPHSEKMTKEDFIHMLNSIDSSFVPPPPTAQSATQGNYLAWVFNKFLGQGRSIAPAYIYQWRGSMAYVGDGKSILETPWVGNWCGGHFIHFIWRLFYWSHLSSHSNRASCLIDWLRVSLRGRHAAREQE